MEKVEVIAAPQPVQQQPVQQPKPIQFPPLSLTPELQASLGAAAVTLKAAGDGDRERRERDAKVKKAALNALNAFNLKKLAGMPQPAPPAPAAPKEPENFDALSYMTSMRNSARLLVFQQMQLNEEANFTNLKANMITDESQQKADDVMNPAIPARNKLQALVGIYYDMRQKERSLQRSANAAQKSQTLTPVNPEALESVLSLALAFDGEKDGTKKFQAALDKLANETDPQARKIYYEYLVGEAQRHYAQKPPAARKQYNAEIASSEEAWKFVVDANGESYANIVSRLDPGNNNIAVPGLGIPAAIAGPARAAPGGAVPAAPVNPGVMPPQGNPIQMRPLPQVPNVQNNKHGVS